MHVDYGENRKQTSKGSNYKFKTDNCFYTESVWLQSFQYSKMHTALTTLQIKTTKKQSISTAFQRLLRSFLVRNMMVVDLWNISSCYLQGPSLTIESMLKKIFHYEGTQPHYRKYRGGKERKKETSYYSSTLIQSLFCSSIVLSNYFSL